MFKKILASVVASVAIANPAMASNSVFAEHQQLWQTLNDVGVTTYVNHEYCFRDGTNADGFYVSSHQVLVVCQDNATGPNSEVTWTDNDLDTLRHEAHHVIQDCHVGARGDDQLGPIFTNDEEWKNFVLNSGYSLEQLQSIAEAYISRGADENTVVFELEAFAVARSIPAGEIAQALVNYCGRR